jgi:soluble lytic murein transglycosylase-like protein
MAGNTALRRQLRNYWLVVCVALLAAASSVVQAQPCNPPGGAQADALANPSAPGSGEKFKLIAQQCDVLAEPAKVQRAAQLDLYALQASTVTLSLPADSALPAPQAGAASAASSAAAAIAAAAPSAAKPIAPAGARVLSLVPALSDAAKANQVDPLLLHAIAHVESRHNPGAVSHAGARGVMQVMPDTARRLGVADPERTLMNAQTNAMASAAYLRNLSLRYGDDLRLVLAAYNAGEGAVAKYGGSVPPYPETQAYVRNVLAVYKRLSHAFAVSKSGALIERGDKS